jgi:two-component system sensor histidine kinase DesK
MGSPSAPPPAERTGPFGRRLGWLAAAVWLFFLGQPIGTAWHHPDPVARYLAVGALTAFGVSFVLLFAWTGRARRGRRTIPVRQALAALTGMLALGALAIPGAGADWLATLVYVAASSVLLLPRRHALVAVLVLAATPLLAPLVVPSWQRDSGVGFAVVLAAFTSVGTIRLAERNADLLGAQEEIHRLAVAGERARAARDLHDILGHCEWSIRRWPRRRWPAGAAR